MTVRRLFAALLVAAAGLAPAAAADRSDAAPNVQRVENAIRGQGRPDLAPTRPAAPKTATPKTEAAKTAAPVVHLLAVAASNDGDMVGKKVGDDARNMAAVFEASFAAAGKAGQLRTRVILGADTTAANLRAAIRGLAVRPQDAVVVFFSGHGGIDRGRHLLVMSSGADLSTRDVLDAVAAHGPRLSVLLTDVCSSFKGQDREAAPTVPVGTARDLPRGRVIPWATVENLFLSHRGVVDLTAAEPGRPGRVEEIGRGSYFTNALIQVLTTPHPAAVDGLDRNGDGAIQWAEVLPQVRAVAGTRDGADNRHRRTPVEPQRAVARSLGTWTPPAVALAR